MPVVEHRGRVMGCELHILAVGGDARVTRLATEHLERLESRWSRYLPDSEVSAINTRPGQWTRVSPDTFRLVESAAQGRAMTGRLFEPVSGPEPDIELDPDVFSVRIDGFFDPNAIGKGLAADLVVAEMLKVCRGALVGIGGDVRMGGEPPDETGWVVAIEDPDRPTRDIARVCLAEGAVVTSSTRHGARRDGRGNRIPHVLDPRTGEVITDELTTTVVAADGWVAEVFATAALVAGFHSGIDLLDDAGLSGLSTCRGGMILTARSAVFR